MSSLVSRAVAVIATCLLLLVPTAAGAAEVDQFAAEASTTSVRLSVFQGEIGDPVLELVGTDAMATSAPRAVAAIDPIMVLGQSVTGARTASSEGQADRDPGEGDGCAVPVATSGLSLSAVCSVVLANAGGFVDTKALSAAQLLDVTASGALLADALTAPLGDFVRSASDLVVEGAIDEFIEECNALLADAPTSQITESAGELLELLPEQVKPITDAASDAAGEADQQGFCQAVFNLSVNDVSDSVLDLGEVAEHLRGLELVTLELDGATSAATGATDGLDVNATQVTMTVSGPDVLDGLDDVIVALVDEIRAAVEIIAGGGDPLPLPDDFDLSAALDEIPLFGIDGPLVSGAISGGVAIAAIDSNGATTAGGTAPFATLALAPGLLELFGQDPESGELSLGGGESQVLAEGTPLESRIDVGTIETADGVAFGDTKLVGATSSTSATTVSLLRGVEGGITLTLGAASAGAFSTTTEVLSEAPDPAPPVSEELPNTGGGAAAAAVLALGAAVALRRRRD